ncbi:MAG: hypothetical protein LKG16_07080 [Bifidobacterium subtile]|jgi:uncharacterized protein YacL|nr:hypothetical protein [Bifidobacterium subtile]MCI1241812.1 hypothetical protein [Bifidobacterium subtile]MCI1258966.1 hypothetical protein [Bifidobacterium subtile]
MNDDEQQSSDSPSASDWAGLVSFVASVVLGMAFPFFAAVAVVHRLLSFGDVYSWVSGWQAVLGVTGIFLVWFFATFITDRIANRLFAKSVHPVLNELAGDALCLILLAALMSGVFVDIRAAFVSSVIALVLSTVLGLAINAVIDRQEGKG